jgi:hypothetical protein
MSCVMKDIVLREKRKLAVGDSELTAFGMEEAVR